MSHAESGSHRQSGSGKLFVCTRCTKGFEKCHHKLKLGVQTHSNAESQVERGDAACVAVVFEECWVDLGPMKNGSKWRVLSLWGTKNVVLRIVQSDPNRATGPSKYERLSDANCSAGWILIALAKLRELNNVVSKTAQWLWSHVCRETLYISRMALSIHT